MLDGSTTLQHTRKLAPESPIMKVQSSADCLVALQQNQVDVIMSDDAVLSGIAAQDPHTSIVGNAIATESYGIAMATPGGSCSTSGCPATRTPLGHRHGNIGTKTDNKTGQKHEDTP